MSRAGAQPPRKSGSPPAALPSPGPHEVDPIEAFERIKAYVGLTEADSRSLRSLLAAVEPRVDAIIDDFYARILRDAAARRAITEGDPQIARLKASLKAWLRQLLDGPHDRDFALSQARIGRIHVKVGLDPIYMVTGIQVFREHISRAVCESRPVQDRQCLQVLEAVDKVLTIVLALMLETFREDFLRKILESEKSATMRRLAALGEVAASMAHEIRNPLAGISGAIQVLSQDLDRADSRQEILREILREIGRLDERVNDMLMYARPSAPSREPTRPSELIETTVRLLSEDPLVGGVRIRVEGASGLPPFPLDPGQVQQVLVNLVLNALQAMKGKGEIWIDAWSQGGGSLQISVEDTGPGLNPEDHERIFRPFFTTRPQGTGLGLSVSRRLIEAHGGTLDVQRGRHGGARFVISLPPPSAGEDAQG